MGKTVLNGKSESPEQTYISREVTVGSLGMGGRHPVRIQSMTNTDTNDTAASLSQCEALIRAGAELVRLTTQGKREVLSISAIKNSLKGKGVTTPIIADVHFNPELAEMAAPLVDKIRINPGNYLKRNLDDSEARSTAFEQFGRLIKICKIHHTAIRVGVNHGSLSERILRKYGDTPLGMAESAMEFIRISARHDFHQLVISLKSSNTRVMIQSVRLLVKKLQEENLNYPVHLGVTEAGNERYGRIKSVVGMAPLLLEGIGDTIRVSLTEDPVREIPVARKIVQLFPKPLLLPYNPFTDLAWDPFNYRRRASLLLPGRGRRTWPAIVTDYAAKSPEDPSPSEILPYITTAADWERNGRANLPPDRILMIEHSEVSIQDIKKLISEFCKQDTAHPIIYKRNLQIADPEDFQIRLAGELGFLLTDGMIDAVWIENNHFTDSELYELLLLILQATGSRISQTEYIACPSCGRTHFDIESRLKEIKAVTSHLKHLKIAVMGCIVNGPGEMADADYGYVGAGKGRISIYRGRTAVYKNIPEEEALDKLLALIREHGDWINA
ncbi:MAG: (E)-4-hydroxy-3-methylbut-2-enyl-diphosphate synthase [Bacteroidales bacterium]|nr:(E)-4-hydroxy-3-methylbut-2-enyl-diphosphate synthase [Bacteroidales bacterium]MBN2699051.1 (E)-4-hydroxy-3-methylbut-2-enyl-diphosphate synthase [Bacteroidales bacterium]